MLKKFIIVILLFAVSFSFLPQIQTQANTVNVSSPSVLLMEGDTGLVLFEKEADLQRPIASVTKVMTLLLTMEAIGRGDIELDEILTTSARAASMGGSDIWLEEGETMSVDDLLKSVVVASANDASVVLGEAISGSEEAFIQLMNTRAKELGMTNTVFMNCNGLDEEGHVSTARDVAIMSRELLKYDKIFEYSLMWIDYVRNGQTQLVNTNKLVKTYNGITGLKTGTTSQAGSCISATAERDGMTLIAVVLGSPDTNTRFNDAKALLDYGFANWSLTTPEFEVPQSVLVANGMEDSVEVEVVGDFEILVSSAKKSMITSVVEIDEEITAPIEKGQQLGKVKIYVESELKNELPIVAKNDLDALDFGKIFMLFLSKFKM